VSALLSKNSLTADGQLWEIKCAVEEGRPLLGLFINKDDQTKPSEMGTASCVTWTWSAVSNFIDSL
jgi:hypothetical protein